MDEQKQPENKIPLLTAPDGDCYGEENRKGGAVRSLCWVKKHWLILAAALTVLAGCGIGYRICASTIPAKIDKAVKAAVEEVYENSTFTADNISTEIDMQIVMKDIRAVGELATVEYIYTDAGKFSDPKRLFGKNIPLTTKSFVMRWDGSIKAGIRDVSAISAEVDSVGKTITVSLPKAEILSHTVNNDSVEVLDEAGGLFNPISVDDVSKFKKESESATEQRALDNGILEKAQKNAETLIKNLLTTNPAIQQSGYSVSFCYE